MRIIIVGGGTAGWMTAAMARRVLGNNIQIELVESEQIGIVGVGEATIPPIQTFNDFLGIDEREFLRETKGTIKLAIRFENWRVIGESYYHTFSAPGANLGFCNFFHYFLRAKKLGLENSLWDFDINYLASDKGVFQKIQHQNNIHNMGYAYHFDSSLYGLFLRKKAEGWGVKRTEGIIDYVNVDPSSGNIQSFILKSGQKVEGDLFVDCTGTRSLLSRETLGVSYESWSQMLPANRAVALQTERFDHLRPFTRSIAHSNGWQWQIPLTHRNGNGIVYSSDYMSDDQALETLLNNLELDPVNDPRLIKFETGRLSQQWHKNVVAIGLSSGFLEPLESTSIHLIQSAIVRFLKMFPNDGIKQGVVDLFNKESKEEYETIRDFIILHYKVNERNDSKFWQDMRNLVVSDRLKLKIEAFAESGLVFDDMNDIFRDSSWLQVMYGQGIIPKDFHPAAKIPSDLQLVSKLKSLQQSKSQAVSEMLSHEDFLNKYVG